MLNCTTHHKRNGAQLFTWATNKTNEVCVHFPSFLQGMWLSQAASPAHRTSTTAANLPGEATGRGCQSWLAHSPDVGFVITERCYWKTDVRIDAVFYIVTSRLAQRGRAWHVCGTYPSPTPISYSDWSSSFFLRASRNVQLVLELKKGKQNSQ
jgi:hypothetical protein